MNKLLLMIACNLSFYLLFAQSIQIPTPQWRPLYHFTPEKNWTNDPNGLIYINGVYHLYNQQNPFENKWGHMSWGHATSKDLMHWKHLGIAIPETIDKDTSWRFSGCAVYDKNNSSGFCKRGGCIVAIYTVHQPNLKKESQFVAYSNDGGMSFRNYEKNPIIDLNKKDFRDPNVFWHEPLQCWIMVVALPTEHKVQFYKSLNLRTWNLLSEFGGNQGINTNGWECPFLIQLPVNGNSNRKKWVLFVSCGGYKGGAFIQYFVGDFDGKTFKNDNPSDVILTVDYGDSFYAAIPWNNLPNDKKIYIGWLVPGSIETYPWKGQMSIPRDLRLKTTNQGIRLFQTPSFIIEERLKKTSKYRALYKKSFDVTDQLYSLNSENQLKENAYWINVEFFVKSASEAGFKLAQDRDENGKVNHEITVGYDRVNKQLFIERNKYENKSINKDKVRLAAFLELQNGRIKMQILVDKSSLEVFANNGEPVISTMIYPPEGANKFSFFAKEGSALVSYLEIWDLSK